MKVKPVVLLEFPEKVRISKKILNEVSSQTGKSLSRNKKEFSGTIELLQDKISKYLSI